MDKMWTQHRGEYYFFFFYAFFWVRYDKVLSYEIPLTRCYKVTGKLSANVFRSVFDRNIGLL